MIVVTCAMIVLGNVNMFGISQKLSQRELFEKYSQVSILVVLSIMSGFVIGRRSARSIFSLGVLLFLVSLLLLIFVEFTGVQKYGARRWINVGGLSIHPTELIKVPIIMVIAYYVAHRGLLELLLVSALVFIVPSALILNHPDYGSAASIIFLMMLSFFVAGVSLRLMLLLTILSVLSFPLIWHYGLKDYHKRRIIGLLEQEERKLEIAYQTVQSKIAIASGGLWGAGVGKGEHGSGRWIPNLHTDFAFASISEDLGFVGSAATLALILILISLIILKALISDDGFVRSTCVLTAGLIFFHAFVNIGMVVGLLPVIGIPLTMISYAGTHNISAGFLLGLCAGVGIASKDIISEKIL